VEDLMIVSLRVLVLFGMIASASVGCEIKPRASSFENVGSCEDDLLTVCVQTRLQMVDHVYIRWYREDSEDHLLSVFPTKQPRFYCGTIRAGQVQNTSKISFLADAGPEIEKMTITYLELKDGEKILRTVDIPRQGANYHIPIKPTVQVPNIIAAPKTSSDPRLLPRELLP
jgi:hypothetical protein